MSQTIRTEPRVLDEIREHYDNRVKDGRALTQTKLDEYCATFRETFGPQVLAGLDGPELLEAMHGRGNNDSLAYWLEFKNDDVFSAGRLGSIAGGSALKFGIYLSQESKTWKTGSPVNQRELTVPEAVDIARKQRDEFIAGSKVLHDAAQADRIDYEALDRAIIEAAPTVGDSAWGHKYFSLLYPKLLDDYHSPVYQRFHLIRTLHAPPDGTRYAAAGHFVLMAAELGLSTHSLTEGINERDGEPYRYWRIGTSIAAARDLWPLMTNGSCIAIGWERIGDLSAIPHTTEGKLQIRGLVNEHHPKTPQVDDKSAADVYRFLSQAKDGDLVLAADGQQILGVGRVNGPYEFEEGTDAPHRRPVNWLSDQEWKLPTKEGLRTTFTAIRDPNNHLQVERQVLSPSRTSKLKKPARLSGHEAHIQSVLERKSQVILHGPPGTGKTFWAEQVACDLAALSWFGHRYDDLSVDERTQIHGSGASEPTAVRMCTFHPAFGYEDFLEGFRPEKAGDQLAFVRRDGIFKTMAGWARETPDRAFYLIIDEINRGDIPRIFGELLTVLEKSKRGKTVQLSLSGAPFSVPPNLFVIGTMNTADRSIALLDTALRRRFGFIELMPDSKVLGGASVEGIALGPWLDALNRRIRTNIGRDARNLQIGHSYLMHGDAPIVDVARFMHAVQDEIVPLLQEYCYEDYDTLEKLLGPGLVDREAQSIRYELFLPGQRAELVQALLESSPDLVASQRAVEADFTPEDDSDDGLEADIAGPAA